jgi:MoaA/NifB/PqqE/SkfB family radical SAM enzyme
MKTFLQKNEIKGLDVELANRCNLKCPLCLS